MKGAGLQQRRTVESMSLSLEELELSRLLHPGGARPVYAVEASDMAEYARKLIAGNPGLSERMTFVAGCGNFFEDSAEQMYQSLCVTLTSLPKPTRVYCVHEYTLNNIRFAPTVEPQNVRLSQKSYWAELRWKTYLPTVLLCSSNKKLVPF